MAVLASLRGQWKKWAEASSEMHRPLGKLLQFQVTQRKMRVLLKKRRQLWRRPVSASDSVFQKNTELSIPS